MQKESIALEQLHGELLGQTILCWSHQNRQDFPHSKGLTAFINIPQKAIPLPQITSMV